MPVEQVARRGPPRLTAANVVGDEVQIAWERDSWPAVGPHKGQKTHHTTTIYLPRTVLTAAMKALGAATQ